MAVQQCAAFRLEVSLVRLCLPCWPGHILVAIRKRTQHIACICIHHEYDSEMVHNDPAPMQRRLAWHHVCKPKPVLQHQRNLLCDQSICQLGVQVSSIVEQSRTLAMRWNHLNLQMSLNFEEPVQQSCLKTTSFVFFLNSAWCGTMQEVNRMWLIWSVSHESSSDSVWCSLLSQLLLWQMLLCP